MMIIEVEGIFHVMPMLKVLKHEYKAHNSCCRTAPAMRQFEGFVLRIFSHTEIMRGVIKMTHPIGIKTIIFCKS